MADDIRNGLKPAGKKEKATKNPDKKYGWFGIYINCLQCVNKPIYFLVFLCFLVLAQGMIITGVTSITITSIQTRFGFTSVQFGAILTSYDTAYGISSVFISFFGHRRKPLCLAIGSVALAVGCFLATVPHYLIGDYHAGVVRDIDWCRRNDTISSISPSCTSGGAWYYLLIFSLAYLTMGIGATPIYILGPSHLDESTKRGQGGFYVGIMYSFAAIGPAIGYLIGKPILNTYVDITQPKDSNLTPDDNIWVGAWWIGYVAGFALFIVVCLPMLGFPQEFAITEKLRLEKLELDDTVLETKSHNIDFKSLFPAMKALLTNKCLMFITLAVTTEGLTTGGFSTFLPKFFQSQFFVSSSTAALYTGIIVVPGAGGGIFLGGYLMKKFNWNCKKILKMSMVFSLLAFLATASMFIGCGTKEIHGVNAAYSGETSINGINSACRKNCSCSSTYKPICTKPNNKMYYSPCHAGCTREDTVGEKYHNCSCFPPDIKMASNGGCFAPCSLMYVFMPSFLLTMLFTFLNNVPLIEATFRVVPESQSSLALGFQQVFVRFLGFIPGPILFGRLVDEACILWQVDQCGSGDNRNCLEYNTKKFRYYFYALGASFKLLSFMFLFFAYKSYKTPSHITNELDGLKNASSKDLVMHEFPSGNDDNQNKDGTKIEENKTVTRALARGRSKRTMENDVPHPNHT